MITQIPLCGRLIVFNQKPIFFSPGRNQSLLTLTDNFTRLITGACLLSISSLQRPGTCLFAGTLEGQQTALLKIKNFLNRFNPF